MQVRWEKKEGVRREKAKWRGGIAMMNIVMTDFQLHSLLEGLKEEKKLDLTLLIAVQGKKKLGMSRCLVFEEK
eukprot:CAMPEP_0201504652 /NCGR_PEP_ID=MMETSP0151_2-20130828/85327_1 /ASSEMBLY_ACC=CAM_ASM_000257 /TAXON_ID=200890 /ORGANISM="Paramoeba atlantica, Strain 621/1 / CCAP 1560/9" /LENGTH=72 /DNA_ID=CAMNT_0047898417 /DNA_START=182 /DNA_END=400 /DNA_ORIENTATION=-